MLIKTVLFAFFACVIAVDYEDGDRIVGIGEVFTEAACEDVL